jgi:hypothetical protein
MPIVNHNQWITTMAKLFNAIRTLTVGAEPTDDNALRRRIRQLEVENQELREKLVYRGPWMF